MKRFNHPSAAYLGLTRVELLLVIVTVGLLTFVLFRLPMVARGHEMAKFAQCLNNLRQLGAGAYLYADEHNRRLPAAERLPTDPVFPTNALPRICDLLTNYVDISQRPFVCPNDEGPGNHPPPYWVKEGSSYEWNYTFNGQLIDRLASRFPAEALLYDYENIHRGPSGISKNVFFSDGRVSPLSMSPGPNGPGKKK